MKYYNELEKTDIVVDSDIMIDDCDENKVCAYLETWFDVDKKFDIDTASDENKWANLYATYDILKDELTMSVIISSLVKCEEKSYTPTENEKKLIVGMMEECCVENYGCSLKQFCEGMSMPISMGGMA